MSHLARGVCRSRSRHRLPTLSSVAVGRCCAGTGGGAPSLITTDGAGTRPLAVGLNELYGDPRCHRRRAGGARAWRQRSPRRYATYRAIARARRRRALLLRRRRGSRLGGIPSFSAAASGTQSSAVCVESAATARLGVAIRLLGQLDHAGGRGWGLAARHWPQFRQIVVPGAGRAAGQRIG
jgi:hypothetical protein